MTFSDRALKSDNVVTLIIKLTVNHSLFSRSTAGEQEDSLLEHHEGSQTLLLEQHSAPHAQEEDIPVRAERVWLAERSGEGPRSAESLPVGGAQST